MDEARQALERRIARLERERWAWRIGIVAVVAGLLGLGAAATPGVVEEVRARKVVVVDAQGKERLSLGTLPDGRAVLVLRDARGKERLELSVLADGSPGLVFWDAQGAERLALGVPGDFMSWLSLSDAQGKVRIRLNVAADGGPVLVLADARGVARTVLGRTVLETIATGVKQERPESSLVFFGPDGKVVWKAP